jgi:two-component sensor histidine kinase
MQNVNHRIRNSLQTVAGLLEMELAQQEGLAAEALQKTIDRIRCIGAVHGGHSSRDPQQVEMKESIRRIAEIVRSSSGRSPEEIAIEISGARVDLDPQRATALSLAVNELMNNAVHHAFDAKSKGKISVSLSQSDCDILLSISDTGRGLPTDFDLERDARVGLNIARAVATQDMGGTFRIFNGPCGTIAQIRFSR